MKCIFNFWLLKYFFLEYIVFYFRLKLFNTFTFETIIIDLLTSVCSFINVQFIYLCWLLLTTINIFADSFLISDDVT